MITYIYNVTLGIILEILVLNTNAFLRFKDLFFVITL